MRLRISVIGFLAGGLCLGILLMGFGCFRSCVSSTPSGEKPLYTILQNQTPVSPLPAPGMQTPQSPLPSPGVQTPVTPLPHPAPDTPVETKSEEASEPREPKAEFSLDAINSVREGMEFTQVMALLGNAGMAVSSRGGDSMIYKWSEGGASLVAKFEQGKLVRKTVLGAVEETREDGGRMLSQEDYNQVQEGMTLEEVMALFDVKVKVVSGLKDTVTIYKWSDEYGSNFTAKFENGKLVRKTGLYISPMEQPAANTEATGPDEKPAALPGEETAVGEEAPESSAPVAEDRPDTQQPETVAENTEDFWAEEIPKTAAKPEPPERVRVAGKERRARQNEETAPTPVDGKSYKPKAKLPQYTYSLRRGTYAISLRNGGDSPVKVGLRSGKRGWNATLSPGERTTAKVEKGDYQLYYIYSETPYALQQGRKVTIDGHFLADVSITLIESSSGKSE